MSERKAPRRCAQVISRRVCYRGKVFDVRQDRVSEPGGLVATRDVVVHPGSVVLLPVLADGRILLVRQYRHAAGEFLWELVAGGIDPGEQPAAAARRELEEETGYRARRLRRLLEFFPSPGFLSERMFLYLAENLVAGAARPESDERLETKAFSMEDLLRRIRRGGIRDGKTIAGILYYRRFSAAGR